MIHEIHSTTANAHAIEASKKLDEIHTKFSARGEREAIYDFARMLRQRMRMSKIRTAKNFVTAYEKAVTDIGDENKVPYAWDKSTEGFVHEVMPFITKELFGVSFAKEVEYATSASSR